MSKKGDNPFFEELDEEEVIVNDKKAEMFSQPEEIKKPEMKDERIIALVEPSLKKRLVNYAKKVRGVKYAVIVREAVEEYLEKRGH